MDEYLLNVVFVRIMIEHRFVAPDLSMPKAIALVADTAGFSPRYVNMILIGDKRNSKALEAIEDAITLLSDAQGGIPEMCCKAEGIEEIERSIRNG